MIKVEKISENNVKVFFSSLQDVYELIDETEKCKGKTKNFQVNINGFTNNFNLVSFEEAKKLLKFGWLEGAKKMESTITSKVLTDKSTTCNSVKIRNEYNVAGFQCSVPRYLQGIPTNMINQKRVVQKQKVMTVVKHIGFLCDISPETIIENSIKALEIIKKIEDSGIRCNLDIISPATISRYFKLTIVIRVKNANERMNIGKIAFPIAHPDMLRKIIFALRLGCANRKYVPENLFGDYSTEIGATIYDREVVKKLLNPGEKYLHNFINDINEEIKNFNLK